MVKLLAHRGTAFDTEGNEIAAHTLKAYDFAINFGADYVEPDLYITKDGVLVCSHDDIKGGFANITYAEALKKYPDLATFSEVIDLVNKKEIETGRKVGITFEIKEGVTKQATLDAADKAVATLAEKGFTDPERIYVNSFDLDALKYMHDVSFPNLSSEFSAGTPPLIKLVKFEQVIWGEIKDAIPFVSSAKAYSHISNDEVNKFVDGYGIYSQFGTTNKALKNIVEVIKDSGKEVHAYTATKGASDHVYDGLYNAGFDAIYVDNSETARKYFDSKDGVNVVYGDQESNNITLNSTEEKYTVYAMQGDDNIVAITDNATIFADGGNDTIISYGGNNVINGGGGNDIIYSFGGNNSIIGGAGINLIQLDNTDVLNYDAELQGRDIVTGNGLVKIKNVELSDVSFSSQGNNLVIDFINGGEVLMKDAISDDHVVRNKVMVGNVTVDVESQLSYIPVNENIPSPVLELEVNGVTPGDFG
ncbi:Glycerophosphoryl diester phosphodiesterase [Serratia sp. JKS296]|uniref:glycerophosphodiester phosphodiesterase family protein n=1 Tax=Serratia sp. JKS296 TaxID=1938824 RepID=UPI000BD24DDB|nr:glycerophosphodiester phosphodiesterase family protein [Serratia sp. JKS296]SOD79455.1 Glycerophosphoryl diester phosphodiesterase [Serratia sp. JKS296]